MKNIKTTEQKIEIETIYHGEIINSNLFNLLIYDLDQEFLNKILSLILFYPNIILS